MTWTPDPAQQAFAQTGGRAQGLLPALSQSGWPRPGARRSGGSGRTAFCLRALKLGCLALFAGALLAPPAVAQATRQFSNTASGAIGSGTACTTPLVRNFTVATNFIIGDVELGVLATHTFRHDIRLTLQSPAGTRQQLVVGNDSIDIGANFNVRLNDGGTRLVNTEDPALAHSTGPAPPYQHNYIPNAPLSVFYGQQSAGIWRLRICDVFPDLDNGTFLRADLYLTPAPNAGGTGGTFVVTSTANSGTATLRQAVVDANAAPAEASAIAFAIPGAGPHTITLASALPQVTANGLIIDAATQPGTQCRDLWAGSGHDLRVNVRASPRFEGFQLSGANQIIRGLSFSGFENAVRLLPGSNTATIQCNYLGLLAGGASNGNTRGVLAEGASVRIGGLDAGQGNVISANSIAGVVTVQGSTDTAVRGNFIGTDATGMSARANGTGINNWFGTATWRDITWNLISGNNGNAGIMLEADDRITPSTDQIRIQRNRIGFNRNLTALMRNDGDGLGFREGSITNVLIGGVASSEGNEITGTDDAVDISQTANVVIQGNAIARSGGKGIRLDNVNGATIGGEAGTLGNTIGGNTREGIHLLGGSGNVAVLGNIIGPVTIAGGTFSNRLDGILLITVSNVTIGDGTTSGRNVIGGNGGRAINGSGTNSNITINGNFIGTDASGNAPAVNGQDIAFVGARDAIAFGQNGSFTNLSVLNNVIGGYEAAMVEFWSGTGNGMTLQGNNLGVGADGVSQIVSGNINDLIVTGGGGNFSDVLIGGSSPGQGNLIAFSAVSGIRLGNDGSNIRVIGNTIRNNARNGIELLNTTRAAIISNRIFDNGLTGIDLSNDGVTLNDLGDGDSGPNDLLNFPEITSVNVTGPNGLAYNFTLDVPASVNGYRVEFFADDTADPSGHGEGERYLAHVDITHGGGVQTYSGTLSTPGPVSIGDIISATTTRRTAGGAWDITSEFSAVASAGGTAELSASMSSDLFEPPADRPFATPGNDVILSTTVSNIGTGYTDVDSIFAVLSVSSDNIFYNGVTPSLGGVAGFESASPLLSFTPASDLAFSDTATRPVSFAQCTYLPQPGYDPLVQHVCLNPKGALPNGSPDGQFTVRIRARIR